MIRKFVLVSLLNSGALFMQQRQLYAASFDCQKATTLQEKAICSDKTLGAYDSQLALAYRKTLAQVSSDAAVQIRQDQKQWVTWLSGLCKAVSHQSVSAMAGCMTTPYEDRIETLNHAVVKKNDTLFFVRSIYLAGKDEDPHSAESPSATFPSWGTLGISWFQADSPSWSAWNNFITKTVMKRASRADESTPQPSDAANADTTVFASAPDVSGDLVSTTLSMESMGHGAAHPGEASWSIHWLKSQSRTLRISDVFLEESSWKKALAMNCWVSLKTQFAEEDVLYIRTALDKELIQVVENPANWSFSAEGLDISFPEYSVAPRVTPVEDITVPWEKLSSYLQPTFLNSLSIHK